MYNALDLAKYIIARCEKQGTEISNYLLQKILCAIQEEYQEYGEQAFIDRIEERPFGSIVPVVYYEYCSAGSLPLNPLASEEIELGGDRERIDRIIDEKVRGEIVSEDLKLCPFCGSKAELHRETKKEKQGSIIRCKCCKAQSQFFPISFEISSDDEAIAAWNRRSDEGWISATGIDIRDGEETRE